MARKDYTNPDLVWSPQRLREHVGERKGQDLILVDARHVSDFCAGHIEGAAHFDLYGVSLNDTRPGPLAAFTWMLAYLFENCGVDYDKTVVLYEDVAGMRAARGFWFLEYLGHEDVHVLDGGLNGWKEAGYPITRDAWPLVQNAPDPKSPRRGRCIVRTAFAGHLKSPVEGRIGTAQYILDRLEVPEMVIHDTRSAGEHFSENIRAARGGTIPGAVHMEWSEALGPGGFLKSAGELRALLESRGLRPEKEVVSLCQGGYRSSHAYMIFRLLGYPRARNYLGSWKEWGDRMDLPIEIRKRPEALP